MNLPLTPSGGLACAAFVGIDWADEKHDVCELSAAGDKPHRETIPQDAEAIAAWVARLRIQFGGRPVAVCLKQARGPLLYALMQYELLVLFPINPAQLASYRAAFVPSGAKDDLSDAELLARFVKEHHERLRAWRPDDETTRGLRLMTEQRRNWVQQRVDLENQLRQRLKESYPLALSLLGQGDLSSAAFLDLLAKFPTQAELQRASPKQLEKWLPKRRRRADDPPPEEALRARIAELRKAAPLTKDRAILDHARLVIVHVVESIRTLKKAVAECDAKIAELFAQHPDRAIWDSVDGAGKALAPRLAAAFGSDRDKFATAADLQNLSGIAPITRASGKTKVVLKRWACPKFLRQTFHELAHHSIRCSRWAAAYVAMRKAAGVDYQTIVRALAFKWIRILFRCWKLREPYDEARHLARLQTTGSPLLRFLAPEPQPNP